MNNCSRLLILWLCERPGAPLTIIYMNRRLALALFVFLVVVPATAPIGTSAASPAKPMAGRRCVEKSAALPAQPKAGPGPLYESLATAPPFQNTGIWRAAPLKVSGADAYVADQERAPAGYGRSEYLYQDFIFDSYGANTTDQPFAQPDTVPASSSTSFGAATGDVVYPTDASTYGYDAADLLEFRARLAPEGIAYRVTLNTMLAKDVAAVAIARSYDNSNAWTDWGYGIGSLGVPVNDVVLSWGTGAEIAGKSLPASVDVVRNQIDVRAPLPTGVTTIRHYVVVGLWDAARHRFKEILELPTSTEPGGAHGTQPPPVFNAGFRFDEPMGGFALSRMSVDELTELGPRGVAFGHMRDHGQAKALAARDLSTFFADIDIHKLASGANKSNVPTSGWLNRLYSSHLDVRGADGRTEGAQPTRPMLLGRIQPYGVYVPETYKTSGRAPAPMHLLMHSLSSSYNQYAVRMKNHLRQIGEERGSFLLVPEGRGPDGMFRDEAELDVFEAWADLAAHYRIDADRVTLGGYSMGGLGTYRLASLYPDLFARGFSVVGPSDENLLVGTLAEPLESAYNTIHIADNLRNIPLLMWNGLIDEMVPVAGILRYHQRLTDLGYRHELDLFPTHDHFLFSIVDEWAPARDFLGQAKVNRNPDRVVYRVMPQMGRPKLGLVHDHAYWVSHIRVAAGASSGLIDAWSRALQDETIAADPYVAPGTEPTPHVKRGTRWVATPNSPVPNTIDVRLSDITRATLWIERAGMDPAKPVILKMVSNTEGTLTLAGAFGSCIVEYPAGDHVRKVVISRKGE